MSAVDIFILSLDRKLLQSLPRVTTYQIFDESKNYHPKGLFSEVIFGPVRDYQCACGKYKGYQFAGKRCDVCKVLVTSSSMRRKQKAVIELKEPVFHPLIVWLYLRKNPSDKEQFRRFSGTSILDKLESFIQNLRNKDFQDLKTKVEKIAKMLIEMGVSKTKYVIVSPPDTRFLFNKKPKNDENHYYQVILKLNETYNSSDAASRSAYVYSITKYYYYLFEHFKKNLRGKEGLIRLMMLGKETDFSGRTVISVNPELPVDTVAIPYLILAEIWRPFVIAKLSEKYNHFTANKIISEYVEYKGKVSDDIKNEIEKAILSIAKDDGRLVIINRQPTLHRPSMRAYFVKPTHELTIQINPLIAGKYNADFDGDQMAVYAYLTDESYDDMDKMYELNNMLAPGSMRFDEVSQNLVYGFYKYTKDEPKEEPDLIFETIDEFEKFISNEDNIKKLEPSTTVFVKQPYEMQTTIGRYLASRILNMNVLITHPFGKKEINAYLTKILWDIYFNSPDEKTRAYNLFLFNTEILRNVINFGSSASTDLTITLDDFVLSKKTREYIRKQLETIAEFYKKNPKNLTINFDRAVKILYKLNKEILDKLSDRLQMIVKSGAKGNEAQMMQMFVAKGFVTDIEGKIIYVPILRGLNDGLNEDQFILMSKASRKGSADRSINTADSGYMTRKFVFALNQVEIDESVESCDTNEFLKIELTFDNYKRYLFRYINDNGNKVLLTPKNFFKYLDKEILLYSPIFCKSLQKKKKLCKTCYGEYNKYLNSRYVGMITSQSLGERTTQLTMRTFHIGASANVGSLNLPEDLFYEEEDGILCARKPFLLEIPDEVAVKDENQLLFATTFYAIDENQKYEITLPQNTRLLFNISKYQGSEMEVSTSKPLFEIPKRTKDIVNAVQYLAKEILETNKEGDLYVFYKELDQIFGNLGVMSIWYEILLSQLIAERDGNYVKLRSLVKIPFERVLTAMSFQDINTSIMDLIKRIYNNYKTTGQKKYTVKDLTIMEKVFLQDL